MSYRLVEVDVTEPLPNVTLGDADGVGLLLRDGGEPLGFLLLPKCGDAVTAEEIERHAVRAGGLTLLQYRLRNALLTRLGLSAEFPDFSVTVTVCTRNRPADLERCLDSIEEAVARFPGHVEMLVVDNAPPDGRTREVVDRRPAVRYATEPVPGLDVARNRALAEAATDWIAFVDDDVRVDRDWLVGLAAGRSEHPTAAAFTGLVLPAELESEAQLRFEQRGGFGRGFDQRRWDGRHGPGGRLHPLGAGVFGAGCDMAYDVAVIRALGGFDEALDTGPPLPGGGDLDGFFKVLAAGHTLVYEPRMAVFHRHRRGLDELRRQYASWGSGFAAFLGARWRDPGERAQILRMVVWWLAYQQREAFGGVRRRDPLEVRMAVAELAGGLGGALGGYARSRRRMAQRRASVAAEAAR